MSGAYTTFEELTRLATMAGRVPLYRPAAAKALMTGGHVSRLRGRGMDFEEYRGYQPGDDIRTIDWRASARTGKTLTRVYREERERPVLLLLDQHPGLFFGSQLNFKSVTAVETLALLGWKALQQGDRVGALLAGVDSQGAIRYEDMRPRRSRQYFLQILQRATAMNQHLRAGMGRKEDTLENLLTSANRLIHPGTLVVVISDFHHVSDKGLKSMALLARHSDVLGVQIVDPFDLHLPPAGLYAISDGQQRRLLDTRPAQVQEHYQQQAQRRQQQLTEHLQRYRIPMLRISSSQPTEEQLITLPHMGGQ